MSLLQRVTEMREERVALNERANEILDSAYADGKRSLNAEEQEKFDKIHADIEEKRTDIERYERQMDTEYRLSQSDGPETVPDDDAGDRDEGDTSERKLDLNDALKRWGREGATALTAEERASFKVGKTQKGQLLEIPISLRAQSVGTDAAGGYTVPESWSALERALLAYGGIRQAARVIRTSDGQKLHIPTVNDTGNSGALIAENTEVDELDVTFSEVDLDAYKYTSKAVRVGHELMSDSLFNLASLLGSLLGERLGRITAAHFTTGTGSAQPQGVVTGATDSTVTAAAVAAVTFAEMVAFKHKIDPAYRMSPSFGFMFNDSTLSALKQVSIGSADARPLWQPGVAVGAPDTIDGSRYWINQQMASMAASAKFALCGDFSNFWIRDVENVRLLRLDERYAEFDQVAFVAFSRHDSVMVNAGTNPVMWIDNAAS